MNPRFVLCFSIGWMITNGWSYVFVVVGTYFNIPWMTAIGGAYMAFLWLPVSAEKVITLTIAILLLKKWFPDDEKTLAVLNKLFEEAKELPKKILKKEEKDETE